MTRDVFAPLSFGQTPRQQAEGWFAMENEKSRKTSALIGKKAKDDNEESSESIAWKRRAQLLLDEGRVIYGSEKAAQQVFSVLVSHGEEARREGIRLHSERRRRRYAGMSAPEAWVRAALWVLILFGWLGFLIWFLLALTGLHELKVMAGVGIALGAIVWWRRRWITSWNANPAEEPSAGKGDANVR